MWSSSAFVQTANEVHSFWARLRFCIQLTFRRESLSAVGYPRRPRAPLRHLRLAKQNAKVRRGTELQKVTRAFTGEAVSSGLPHFKKHPAVTSRSAVHAEFQRWCRKGGTIPSTPRGRSLNSRINQNPPTHTHSRLCVATSTFNLHSSKLNLSLWFSRRTARVMVWTGSETRRVLQLTVKRLPFLQACDGSKQPDRFKTD